MFGFTFIIFAPLQQLSVDRDMIAVGFGLIIRFRDHLTEDEGQCIWVEFSE